MFVQNYPILFFQTYSFHKILTSLQKIFIFHRRYIFSKKHPLHISNNLHFKRPPTLRNSSTYFTPLSVIFFVGHVLKNKLMDISLGKLLYDIIRPMFFHPFHNTLLIAIRICIILIFLEFQTNFVPLLRIREIDNCI